MILIFNKFDLNRRATNKLVKDITINDVVVDMTSYPQTSMLHRASVIVFHDLNTGNFIVLKHRNSDIKESGVINKYNKGKLIDLIRGNG